MFRHSIVVLLFFFLHTYMIVFSINEMCKCASYGDFCNPGHPQACCSENTTCKLSTNNYVCLIKGGLGDSCSPSQNCSNILHAQCTQARKCDCISGYNLINGKCVPSLGRFCWKNEKCAKDNSVCIGNECRCAVGFIQHKDQCVSNSTKYVGMPCRSSDFCRRVSIHSTCNNDKRCECKRNFVLTRKGCVSSIHIACEDNIADCIPKVKLNDLCIDHRSCGRIKFSVCGDNDRCVCRANYFQRNDTKCDPGLGEYCTEEDRCIVENSICINNMCQCESTEKYIDGKCPKIDQLGKFCETDFDCEFIKNSRCTSNRCVCRNDYSALHKSACGPNLNEFCSNNTQCLFENFHCANNKCQCKPGFVAVSNIQCVDNQFIFSCTQAVECSDYWHSMCSEQKCVCKPQNVAIGRSCLPMLTGSCWRDDQCMAANSKCVDYHCECKENFIAVATNLCVLDH